MKQKPPPFVAALVTLGLPVLMIVGVLHWGGCSDPDAERAGDPPGTEDELTRRVVEEIFGARSEDEPEPLDVPELSFLSYSRGLPTGGTWREHPLLHDFTADGRADLVASNREEDGLNAWKAPGDPLGAWIHSIEGLPRDLMYGGSSGADLDRDGDQDLVFVAHSEGLRVFLNDGDMRWVAGETVPNPFLMLDVATGDLNGDHLADAVGIGHFNGGIGVYLGDGAGSFRRLDQSKDILPAGRFGTQVELADIDQNGLDDIVACTDKGAKVFYTSKGSDAAELSWREGSDGLPKPEIGNALRGLIPADFTGDGKLDLAFCQLPDPGVPEEQKDDAGLLRRNEDGTWTRIDKGMPRGLGFRDVAAADLDRDGSIDLVLAGVRAGVIVLSNKGDGSLELRGKLAGTRDARSIALGDVDGDGWLDIGVLTADTKAHPKGGGLAVFLNRPEAWQKPGKE